MLTQEEKQFVQENLEADIRKLLLNPPIDFKNNIQFLADQIVSRQKAKGKLPTWVKNLDLIFPPPLSVEQSSSEVLAIYKAKLASGTLLIDLTGGMGIDCLAMSASFENAIYVEADEHLCDCFRHNSKVHEKTIQIENQTAESFLKTANQLSKPVIFVDPDRRSDSKKMVRFTDCSPDISELVKTLKNNVSQLFIKASPLLDIKAGIADLTYVKEVHVVSVKNECKEVLFLLDFAEYSSDPVIKTVNILAEGEEQFDFTFSEEEKAMATMASCGEYLLLPNASILKGGAFRLISDRFGLSKMASNTHIYSYDHPVMNFPGRQFKIISHKVTTHEINEYLPNRMANVITKNYPTKPNDVLKKFKLKEGGELYLIGFRDSENKAQLVIAEKI